MKSLKAEILRKKYKYREYILKGKLKLSIAAAKKLIGPDTAYHLYSKLIKKKDKDGEGESS